MRTGQLPVSTIIRRKKLGLFGHVAGRHWLGAVAPPPPKEKRKKKKKKKGEKKKEGNYE